MVKREEKKNPVMEFKDFEEWFESQFGKEPYMGKSLLDLDREAHAAKASFNAALDRQLDKIRWLDNRQAALSMATAIDTIKTLSPRR